MPSVLSATVRMYRFDELGDCFLLTFKHGDVTSRMLVDCGSFRNSSASKTRLREIVSDIAEEANGASLDVVIGTHQHNDHVSGFVHCEDEFRQIGIEEVWLPWLDDPQDKMAQEIGRKHKDLQVALHSVRQRMQGALAKSVSATAGILDDVLGFYGASKGQPPALPAEAVSRLKTLGRKKPRYLRPGTVLDMPGLSPGQVRVYILGPPRDQDSLRKKNPREGESYDHALSFHGAAASRFLSAVEAHSGSVSSDEAQYPFSDLLKQRGKSGSSALSKLRSSYARSNLEWRSIDHDWLEQSAAMALFLDSFTNNASLVLAIELVTSGKVLLFAADAQTGNWLSWDDIVWKDKSVSLEDLLARTVLYKVGHHGSHNATLVAALEKMNHPDLIGLIPVHKKDPNIAKANGWKMPARNLLRRLREKTSNRVLQMDGIHAKDCNPSKEPARSAWKASGAKLSIKDLFMQVEILDK